MITRIPQPANDAEWSFWQQLPPQIDTAVRKVFHWERTDIMSTAVFWGRVVERTMSKVESDFIHKAAAGMSFADWRAQIRNLEAFITAVAKCAAIEEARKILHLRSKGKRPAKGELVAYITPPPLMGSHDPAELILGFVQRTLPLHERARCLEHFRSCAQCFSLLQVITRRKNDGGVDPLLVPLVNAMAVKEDAIQINLAIKDSIDWKIIFFRSSKKFLAKR